MQPYYSNTDILAAFTSRSPAKISQERPGTCTYPGTAAWVIPL